MNENSLKFETKKFEPLFLSVEKLLAQKDFVILAIEGGSASGKSTLSKILSERFDCNVFHMDDFFLRPEQRTPDRFLEAGGNVDRERFYDEVILPLSRRETVLYRAFDCSEQKLRELIEVKPKKLTVIEGAYSMHPMLSEVYDLSVFLDIEEEYQKERILKRNSPSFAKRFFEKWIPLERKYFSELCVKERCDMVIKIG